MSEFVAIQHADGYTEWVDPFAVKRIEEDCNCCTVHVAGGGSFDSSMPGEEVRDIVTAARTSSRGVRFVEAPVTFPHFTAAPAGQLS